LRCNDCGHTFLQAVFSSEQIKDLYSHYYPRSTFDLTSYAPLKPAHGFGAWLNGVSCSAYSWVPENVRILDIGCGFGQSLGYHKARSCDVYGVEADANIRRVAEAYGFKVHVGLFDPSLYEPGFFDYVTMDQVIEHAQDPVALLQGVFSVLKSGGKLIISTPNSNGWGAKLFGFRWINWHAPYHLQQFSLNSMSLAARKSGLVIESYSTKTSSEWLYYQWLHLIAFPRIGEPSSFWSPKGTCGFKVRWMFRLLSYFHRTRFDHLLTRFFDSLGFGDNYLFFLRRP
jgi:SAM-dependent methyltransferase